jgi:hypothetical protein
MSTLDRGIDKQNKWLCKKCHTWVTNMKKTCSWCGNKNTDIVVTEEEKKKNQKSQLLNNMYKEVKDLDIIVLQDILTHIKGIKNGK